MAIAAAGSEPVGDAAASSRTAQSSEPAVAALRESARERIGAAFAEGKQANRLLQRGEDFFAQGNVAVARQFFARAADLGLPLAAFRLAETYDPLELERRKTR